MMRALLLSIVVSTLSGCGDRCEAPGCELAPDATLGGPDAPVTGEDLVFRRLVDEFESPEECPNDGLPNCYAQLTLCSNRGLVLVLTDIAEEGSYTRTGNTFHGTVLLPANSVTFTAVLEEDGTLESKEIGGRHPWLRVSLDESRAQQVADSCASLEGRSWWPPQ